MTGQKRGEFLKDKAERFFKNALELFQRKEYDLSAFNLEQSVQLFLKYALWKKLGDFEKTHEISELLEDFKAVSAQKSKITELILNHQEGIAHLEITYIESRYLPAQFFEKQVERMIDFVQQLKTVIDQE